MRKTLLQFFFISLTSVLLFSCEKEDEEFPIVKSKEKTIIQLPGAAGGDFTVLALDLGQGVVTIDMLEIRRDAATAAELNKPQVVKIKLQNALISDPTGGAVKELPRHLYTNHPDNPFDGQFWTVTFQP